MLQRLMSALRVLFHKDPLLGVAVYFTDRTSARAKELLEQVRLAWPGVKELLAPAMIGGGLVLYREDVQVEVYLKDKRGLVHNLRLFVSALGGEPIEAQLLEEARRVRVLFDWMYNEE